MNKKLLYKLVYRNLSFGFLTIIATLYFMIQIFTTLLPIRSGGILTNIQYNIFGLKISVVEDTYSHVYNIFNYPLLPILAGVIYNIYIIIKNHRNKDNVSS